MRLFEMSDSGNCYKVRLTAAHVGVALERIETDITRGASRTVEFLARNPNGRVPTLQLDDGSHLAESNAIICYLAWNAAAPTRRSSGEAAGAGTGAVARDTALLPAEPLALARVLQWLFFEQYSHERFIATNRYWIHILGAANEHAEAIAANMAPGYAALGVMESHLTSTQWFGGSTFSVADIALYAYTHVADQGGFELDGYPAVQRWLAQVAARPGHVPMHA